MSALSAGADIVRNRRSLPASGRLAAIWYGRGLRPVVQIHSCDKRTDPQRHDCRAIDLGREREIGDGRQKSGQHGRETEGQIALDVKADSRPARSPDCAFGMMVPIVPEKAAPNPAPEMTVPSSISSKRWACTWGSQ